MLDVLSQFLDMVSSLVSFAVNAITSLISLISKIPTYSAFLVNSINVLPAFIIPFAILAIMIYFVLFVMGR